MGKPQSYSIEALELGPMENFVYLIHDHATDQAAVVDPAWDVERIVARARERGLRITDILLTHSHYDHVNGVEGVQRAFDARLHLLKAEATFWGRSPEKPALHHGGDVITLGETEIGVLHTPGHTPGSACYRAGDDLIAGDTLFVFGCGRCDLAGGDPEAMYDTLRRLRRDLPGTTVIRPGHNYAEPEVSTLEEQEEGNPFFHFDKRDEFVYYRMEYHDRHRHTPYHPVARGHEME